MTRTRRSPPRGPAGDSEDPTLQDIHLDAPRAEATAEPDEEPPPSLADRFTDWRRHYLPLPDEVVDEYLAEDEYVIHSDHPSFRAFLIQNVTQVALATIMLPVVFAFVRMDLEWWWILLMVLGLDLVLLVLAIKRLGDRYTSYVITNLRLIRVSGIISRKLASIPWTRMTGLGYRQKPIGRLMGFATIHIESANEESGLREFSDINDPATFHQLILDMTMSKAGVKPEKPTKGVRRTLRQRRRDAREAAKKAAEDARVEAQEAAAGGDAARSGDGEGSGEGGSTTSASATTTGSPSTGAAAAAAAEPTGDSSGPAVAVKDPTPPSGTPMVRINPPPGSTVTGPGPGRRRVRPAADTPAAARQGGADPTVDPSLSGDPASPPDVDRPRARRSPSRPGTPGPGPGGRPPRGDRPDTGGRRPGRAPDPGPGDPSVADLGGVPGPAPAGGRRRPTRRPDPTPPPAPEVDLDVAPDQADDDLPDGPVAAPPPRGAGAGPSAAAGRARRRPAPDEPRTTDDRDVPPADRPRASRRVDVPPPPAPGEEGTPPSPGPGPGPITPPRQRLAGPRRQVADAGTGMPDIPGMGDGPGTRRTRPPGNRPGSWAWPGGQRTPGDADRPPPSPAAGTPAVPADRPGTGNPPAEPLFERLRRDVERLRASIIRPRPEIDPETGEKVSARDAIAQVRRGRGKTPLRRPRFPNFGRSRPAPPSNRQLPASSAPPSPPAPPRPGRRPPATEDE